MELRNLEYFLAAANELNVTRAAQLIHVTQPTVSRAIMQLEEELGKPLFSREGHALTLTDEGLILQRRAVEILSLVEKTQSELTDNEEEISGTIAIGMGECKAVYYELADIVEAFVKKYPRVNFHYFTGAAGITSQQLDQGALDFGIVIEPIARQKYNYLTFPEMEIWGMLMREDHPLATKEGVCPKDLIGQVIIGTRRNYMTDEFENWAGSCMKQLDIRFTQSLLCNSIPLIHRMNALALCVDGAMPGHDMTGLKFVPLQPDRKLGTLLIWKKNMKMSPTVQNFLNFTKEYLLSEKEAE